MASDPPADLALAPLTGEARTVREWLTVFHLALFVIDPYTNESSWLLDACSRVMAAFGGADVRVAWLVTSDADGARSFLGPLADRFLTLCDPDRAAVKALGLERLPAFVVIRQDGSVLGTAEGWRAEQWRDLCGELAELCSWRAPDLPHPRDPAPFAGTAALASA